MDFHKGIALGIGAAMVVVQFAMSLELAALADMYRDFGGTVPALSRVAVSPAWLWGLPIAGAAAVTTLYVKRPARVAIYVAAAVTVAVLLYLTVHYARLPITELAGKIK